MDNRNRRTPIANSSVQQSKPQAHSSQPQVRSSQPQVRSSQPHARSSQPQVRSSQPHARSSQPQIRSKQHNRRLPSPELDLDFSALSLRDNDTPSYAVARTQQRFPQAHRSEPVTAIRTKPYLGRKHFFNLPIEIQIQIFSHLDLISRIRLLKTSKRTREISLASSWSILDFPLFRRLKNEDVVKFLVGTLTPLARSMVHELNLSNALPENSTNFSCVGSSLRLLPNLRVFKCRGYPLPKIREQFLKLERHNPAVRLRLRRFECAPARLQSDGIGDIRRVLYALAEGPIELDVRECSVAGGSISCRGWISRPCGLCGEWPTRCYKCRATWNRESVCAHCYEVEYCDSCLDNVPNWEPTECSGCSRWFPSCSGCWKPSPQYSHNEYFESWMCSPTEEYYEYWCFGCSRVLQYL